MIIAEHGDIHVAKRASRTFEDLKDGSLGKLLQGYDFHYAEYAIKLCADIESLAFPSEEAAINLCGLHVLISSPGECMSAPDTVWTHATIGGCVEINGKYYGLTAAHAFPDVASRGGLFSDEQGTSKASTGKLHTRKVYAHRGRTLNFLNDEPTIPAQTPDLKMLLNCTSTDLEGSESSSIPYYRNHDWALIPITNRSFALRNQLELGNGQTLSLSGLAESLPQEPVYVASGVTQPSATEVSGLLSAMLLPGPGCLQIVCVAYRQSGESGIYGLLDYSDVHRSWGLWLMGN
ncbi:MAG: hypothetical protein Q9160_005083 [Pyrenula sp. 1 TL-2023]